MEDSERKVVVVGQVARDLVLSIDEVPDEGGSATVRERQEMLGGKGANQGVACRQLGARVELIGVVGDDAAGREVLEQAADDGIGMAGVVRRAGARTPLLLDLVGPPGVRRLVEDVDDQVLLRPDDVEACRESLRSADAVLVQLQQPGPAVAAALDACAEDALVVADGAPADEETRRRVLARADVVRADSAEIQALVGWKPDGAEEVVRAAQELLGQGPRVVALSVSGGGGDVVAWPAGHVVLPLLGEEAVDPTGGGDSFVAALAMALLAGETPELAAWWAAVAAADVVRRPGGRPELDADRLRTEARRAYEEAAATTG
ncbi:PfkB family carbohydrate kinase [Arthrobacter sp. VKM Ac-2550]|uniref:PfkB family carbohydrate kinase n=1 Tax=Crystallibacter permensis TaxID=1938888 RepID=UPI0022273914|nr:PfkB family carbohydrate kinase [Arthrobacter sp. VKM Ac-2550]MCW2134564.1 ribokinase [Arthrobacter sp. VKM Ac-2550]